MSYVLLIFSYYYQNIIVCKFGRNDLFLGKSSCITKLPIVVCQSGVRLVRGIVKEVHPQKIILNDGTEVPYGLLVWSTGVGPSPFIESLQLPKSRGGRYRLYYFIECFTYSVQFHLVCQHADIFFPM